MTLLCASPRCYLPGRHAEGCDDRDCRGCQTARAADGLRLCLHCGDRIAVDAVKAASMDPALALALTPQGEPGRRGDHGGITLSDAALDARTMLRAVLTSWCRMVAEERGIQLPGAWVTIGRTLVPLPNGVEGPLDRTVVREYRTDERPMALGAYIATHARWLAAHPAAGECADELADLARQTHAAAYPSGTRVIPVGPCPATVDDQPCAGQIRALLRTDASLLPSAVACDTVEEHAWSPDQWRALGRHMSQRVVRT